MAYRWQDFLKCETCKANKGCQCIGRDGPKSTPCDGRVRNNGKVHRAFHTVTIRVECVCEMCGKKFMGHVNSQRAEYVCCRDDWCIVQKERRMKADRLARKQL